MSLTPEDLNDATVRISTTMRESLKHIAKNVHDLLDGEEVRAWDRFMSAIASSAPPMNSPQELIAYCEQAGEAFILRRRELFDDGPGIPRTDEGSRLRKLVESAQQLEAKNASEGFTRADLAERAKLLRDRIDIALGVTPPESLDPLTQSPSARNAAAERRAVPTNGAATAVPPLDEHPSTNGSVPQ